ncbi:hypothetical protein GmRootA79_03940 [Acidovorax sp. A79]
MPSMAIIDAMAIKAYSLKVGMLAAGTTGGGASPMLMMISSPEGRKSVRVPTVSPAPARVVPANVVEFEMEASEM